MGAAPAQRAYQVERSVRLDDQPYTNILQGRFRHQDHRRIEVGFNAGQPQRTPLEQSLRGDRLGSRELVEPGVSLETDLGQIILGAAESDRACEAQLTTIG